VTNIKANSLGELYYLVEMRSEELCLVIGASEGSEHEDSCQLGMLAQLIDSSGGRCGLEINGIKLPAIVIPIAKAFDNENAKGEAACNDQG